MKKFWLGIVGLAAASTANAAGVTFTLSYHDDGTGAVAPGAFAIYADVSQGDNSGLFAFGIDLVDNQINSITNLSTNWHYRKTTGTTGPGRFAGFGTGISEDAATGKISGVTDLAKGTSLLPVYGFGQKDIDMNAAPPNGPRPSLGGVQYNISTDQNPNEPGPLVKAHMLLGTGTFSLCQAPAWEVGSGANTAAVYALNGGASGTDNFSVSPVLQTINLAPAVIANSVTLDSGRVNPDVAIFTGISVGGANGNYISEVDDLIADNLVTGSASITSIGSEAGSVYILLGLNGSAADIAAVNQQFNAINSSDPQFALLHAAYDSRFAGGVDAIFRYPNTDASIINFDFSCTGVTVDQIAAVPEPSIGILGLASLYLLARRRRIDHKRA